MRIALNNIINVSVFPKNYNFNDILNIEKEDGLSSIDLLNMMFNS
jgi:hypothetical protein